MMPFDPIIESAIELAAEWHDGTYRKGRWRKPTFHYDGGFEDPKVPTMAHLTAVAIVVQRAGFSTEAVSAAYLHDLIEDTNKERKYYEESVLREKMGDKITDYVMHLSEPKLGEDGKMMLWQDRKDVYLAGLKDAPLEVVAISVADKLHNIWSMNQSLANGIDIFKTTKTRKGLSAGVDKQIWYFESVIANAKLHTDDRLSTILVQLEKELVRFKKLVA